MAARALAFAQLTGLEVVRVAVQAGSANGWKVFIYRRGDGGRTCSASCNHPTTQWAGKCVPDAASNGKDRVALTVCGVANQERFIAQRHRTIADVQRAAVPADLLLREIPAQLIAPLSAADACGGVADAALRGEWWLAGLFNWASAIATAGGGEDGAEGGAEGGVGGKEGGVGEDRGEVGGVGSW